MTALPANDIANSVAPAKVLGSHRAANAHNEGRAAGSAKAERATKSEGAVDGRDSDGRADDLDGGDPFVSFDRLVESLGDAPRANVAEPAPANNGVMQFAALAPQLAAIFQNATINNANALVGAESAPNAAHVSDDSQANASQVDGLEIAAADFVLPDSALRAKTGGAASANAIDANVPLDVSADRVVVDAAAPAVSVQQLKRDTGFDAPIAIKTNQQSWFQSAATVLAKVQMAASKDMRSGDVKPTLENSTVAQRMGNGLLVSGLERSVDQMAPYGQGSSEDRTSGDPANGRPANGDAKAERAAFLIKGASAAAEIETTAQTTIVTTPYQQVRAAVVEAIAGAGSAQQTDYVSLHADRPAGNTLTLKTLELTLSPPDLGRVNVKMNLTARDLTLELDASQASTAKLLSDDQQALKRDLLGDELDLSSVVVSVKTSVSEASASSGLSNGDQQASGGSRSPSQDASASMTGGNREERRSSQNSAYGDDSSARDRADTQTGARGAERTASEIYI